MAYCRLFLLILSFSFQLFANEPSFTLYIPMRDGTALPTDIYLPAGQTTGLPCILIRTPAGRAQHSAAYTYLTNGGYMVAIQDSRSFLDGEGKTLPCIDDGWGERQDGYDTVEWLAKSNMTNGKIGTIGFSAMGISQLLMAPTAPPSLKCQYISVAPSNLQDHAFRHGGKFLKNQVEGWLGFYARHPSVLEQILKHPENSDFWKNFDAVATAEKTKSPAIHYGGWFDVFSQGTIDAYVSWQDKGGEGAKGKQKMIMGPWGHYWPLGVQDLGDFKVPEKGKNPPFDISPISWFDYHLKGVNNEIDKIPNVIYYVMGPFDGTPSKGNVWKSADHWPVPATETSYYLGKGKSLQKEAPKEIFSESYQYDPKNPTPTLGGRNLFLEIGPKDQRKIESRSDVVVFTSSPLEEDLEVTGRIKAKIWFSSNCEDTDVAVKLTDVYPDEKSILIADGIRRLHHTNPNKKTWSEPEEIEVDLWSTSMVFAKGHKIRVVISSANYPKYEINHNKLVSPSESEEITVALNKIHMGEKYPSQVVLPVIMTK